MRGNSCHEESEDEFSKKCMKLIERWWHKCRGVEGLQIPPAMSWNQSLWALIGAFFGFLWISVLNENIKYSTNDKFFVLMGPIGALMTLQYGLTSAPASQPRNIILGQVLS